MDHVWGHRALLSVANISLSYIFHPYYFYLVPINRNIFYVWWQIYHVFVNSLLPVSRYIDTAFADKGSHQKKNLQPKCPDTSKFGLLGKPTKKLELNPLFQSIFETSKFQKLKKSCFFLFWKNIFLTPPPLNCLYLRPSISDFTNFFFAESVMDSSIILK